MARTSANIQICRHAAPPDATLRGASNVHRRFTGPICQYTVLTTLPRLPTLAAMSRESKSAQLQIRVTATQKAALERAARDAGIDMSAYVLHAVLPSASSEFTARVQACLDGESLAYALAELNGFLTNLSGRELVTATSSAPPSTLTGFAANYVAAMVEQACDRAGEQPPSWIHDIEPLSEPYFGSTLTSLRLYLLTHSPPPFRKRNLFVDSTVGDQV